MTQRQPEMVRVKQKVAVVSKFAHRRRLLWLRSRNKGKCVGFN